MPETILKKIRESILPVWRICFFSALIVGLIAHLYKITSWLPNWDSLVFRYDGQNMINMGRWFLPVVCAPGSFYDLPLTAGLSAIILHALGAVCICKMMRIKSGTAAFLTGALVAAFPTVTSVMTYNYVADGYAAAFLMSCIAAMLMTDKKPKYILSALLIALSAGTYQAYITVTVMLLLLHLITELVYNNEAPKKLIFKGFRFLLTGGAGMALYYLILMVLLDITRIELLDYQGLGDAVALNGFDLGAMLHILKTSFMGYFFDFSDGISAFCVINVIIFALTVVLYIADIIRKRLNIGKILLLIAFVIMLPVGASLLAVASGSIDYHNLMKMGFMVFYMFIIMHYEASEFKSARLNAAKQWTILAVVCALIFNHIIIANVTYHHLTMAYERSYGTLIRIADRIEQTEGADECDEIIVLGQLENSKQYSVKLPPDMTGSTDGYILRADDPMMEQSVLCSALNDYCGKNYRFLHFKEKMGVISQIDLESMGIWPEKDSVAVVHGVIVIRLSETEAKK